VHSYTRQDKTRQDKTRQDKTRQDKTRQDKTRQDKTRHKKNIDHLKNTVYCPAGLCVSRVGDNAFATALPHIDKCISVRYGIC